MAARHRLALDGDILLIEIVERRREMRGGPRRHASPDRPAIENHDALVLLGEFIGRRQACNAAADHDDVADPVRVERRIPARLEIHPAGPAFLKRHIHCITVSAQ
jgi:hypothetical protein